MKLQSQFGDQKCALAPAARSDVSYEIYTHMNDLRSAPFIKWELNYENLPFAL
jgi:hypothetical protein